MPINPVGVSTDGTVTAKILNTDLYTYTPGNNFTPNGVLLLANRQLLFEALFTCPTGQASSAGGTFTSMTGVNFVWTSFFDSAALFGGGGDTGWDTALGRYNPAIPGSTGNPGSEGGIHLIWGFPNFAATNNAGGSGAALNENGTVVPGGFQLSSTTHSNGPYVMDLVNANATQYTNLEGWCADASGGTFTYSAMNTLQDWSGQQSRFYGMWVAVNAHGATPGITVPPAPTAWTAASAVTSATLNGNGYVLPLEFSYNPPCVRVGSALSTAIPANTATLLPLTIPQIDNWNGWSNASNQWVVPVTGVYLVHGMAYYTSASTGQMQAGIRVNGGTVWWGPAYTAGTGNHSPQVTRLLDLQQGDTVQLYTAASAADTISSLAPCRLLAVWMSTIAGSSGSVTWPAPDPSFRWQAGTPGSNLTTAAVNLTAQFQSHLTSDLSFFLQRPYLLTYQNTAQTALSQNVYHTITMDTVSGVVHGSAGDNYGGWTSGGSNKYTAPVSGWYLVQGQYVQTALASGTASLIGAILPSPIGNTSPDVYQHISTTSTNELPGADAIGVYYLRAGDTVTPQYQQQDGGATYNTISHTSNAGHECNFSVVWLCE